MKHENCEETQKSKSVQVFEVDALFCGHSCADARSKMCVGKNERCKTKIKEQRAENKEQWSTDKRGPRVKPEDDDCGGYVMVRSTAIFIR